MFEVNGEKNGSPVLMVTGSLDAKPEDRKFKRSQINPVQVLLGDDIKPVHYFDEWGELGISSMAWHWKHPFRLYFSTGRDLNRIDLGSGRINQYPLMNLCDIHEMSIIDNLLWIANSGNDEAIAFDIEKEVESKRIKLSILRSKVALNESLVSDDPQLSPAVDKFHCNQIFKGFDGHIYALVHHVTGKQLIKKVAEKVIKTHGNGGVINLETGKTYHLNLKGPHSARKVGQEYWLFDSGNGTLNIYDPKWELTHQIFTGGWGRGADFSLSRNLYYSGISETRRHYFGLFKSRGIKELPNMVQVLDIDSKQIKRKIIFPNGIEQINNVYLLHEKVALNLLALT